jgi:hypothetical protein
MSCALLRIMVFCTSLVSDLCRICDLLQEQLLCVRHTIHENIVSVNHAVFRIDDVSGVLGEL